VSHTSQLLSDLLSELMADFTAFSTFRAPRATTDQKAYRSCDDVSSDRNNGSKDAEERFRRSPGGDVLRDPQKRAYDLR
jgi:hypothetical protein